MKTIRLSRKQYQECNVSESVCLKSLLDPLISVYLPRGHIEHQQILKRLEKIEKQQQRQEELSLYIVSLLKGEKTNPVPIEEETEDESNSDCFRLPFQTVEAAEEFFDNKTNWIAAERAVMKKLNSLNRGSVRSILLCVLSTLFVPGALKGKTWGLAMYVYCSFKHF